MKNEVTANNDFETYQIIIYFAKQKRKNKSPKTLHKKHNKTALK